MNAIDLLVEDAKTFIEIIRGSFRSSPAPAGTDVFLTALDVFSQLADEVSIIETERSRLSAENKNLKIDSEAALVEITRLAAENQKLREQITELKAWNKNQFDMLSSVSGVEYMYQKKFSKHIEKFDDYEDYNETNYALNA